MIAIYFLLLYPLLLSFWFPGGFGCVHFLLDRSPAFFCFLFHENQLVVVDAIISCSVHRISSCDVCVGHLAWLN